MTNNKDVAENFEDMLTMLKKKLQEKDAEIERLTKENGPLKEALPKEIDSNTTLVDETLKRR